jgi:hypothetical protein
MPRQGIAPAPRRIPASGSQPCGRGRRRFRASFRRVHFSTFWRLGFRQSQLSPYRAGRPAHRPIRLGTATGFLACCCPLHLTDPGKPSGPQTPPPICARYTGYTTVRLVAHEALLAANDHGHPATLSHVGSRNCWSDSTTSYTWHHHATLQNRLILKQVAAGACGRFAASSLSWPKRLIPDDRATGDQGSQRSSYSRTIATRHTYMPPISTTSPRDQASSYAK